MSGEIKINRIKSRHQAELGLLGEVTKRAQEAIPKLRSAAENRVAFRNMAETMSTLGAHVRSNGFDPTRKLQYVANYDDAIWNLVLAMFAKYEVDENGEQTGNFMDDGLLYKYDEEAGCVKLNKDFFYALLSYFESVGVEVDMRGKIKLN